MEVGVPYVVAAFGFLVGAIGIGLAIKTDRKLKAERALVRGALLDMKAISGDQRGVRVAIERLVGRLSQ